MALLEHTAEFALPLIMGIYCPLTTDLYLDASFSMHKIRITLTTAKDVEGLTKVCNDIVRAAKAKQVTVKGPTPMKTKVLRQTVRKSPCGEGTNTWDRFEMRIHKRGEYPYPHPCFGGTGSQVVWCKCIPTHRSRTHNLCTQ